MKTLISLGFLLCLIILCCGCWSEFTGCTGHFVGFVMLWLKFIDTEVTVQALPHWSESWSSILRLWKVAVQDRTQIACSSSRYCLDWQKNGPRQANLVLIAYASSEGSGEPAHPRSLARTSATRSYKQWVKRNLQTESQIPGPSEWLGMRS